MASYQSFTTPSTSSPLFKIEPDCGSPSPPLVRPIPSYPRVHAQHSQDHPPPHYMHRYHPQPCHTAYSHSRQTFDQQQTPSPPSFGVNPPEVSDWGNTNGETVSGREGGPSMTRTAGVGQPFGFSDGAESMGEGRTMQPGFDLSLAELPPSHPHHLPPASFAPHVFSNHQLHHPHPPSTIHSPSSMDFPPQLQHHRSRTATQPEPADAPWNLVPYLPFAGSNNPTHGSNSAAPNPAAATTAMLADAAATMTSAAAVVAANNNAGMFLRSPTPTKRQRTNQACEKCRDRKAKCNGGRPSCQRCLQRGLVCEYAKERRMRGPNKPMVGQSGGNNTYGGVLSAGAGGRQRIASSPARQQQQHANVSVHISSGQGTSPPPDGSSPPHPHRRQVTADSHPYHRGSSPATNPIYRTLHVAQSHPDLHVHTDFSGTQSSSSASSSPLMHVGGGAALHPHSHHHQNIRPRSRTTPYPLIINSVPTHPSPLYNAIRSGTADFSSSETSEPPSATSSSFGAGDLQGAYTAANGQEMYPSEYETAALHGTLDVMGLSAPAIVDGVGRSSTATTIPIPTGVDARGPAAKYLAGNYQGAYENSSPDTYQPTEFDEVAAGNDATARWTGGFELNVNTSMLQGHGGGPPFSGVSTASVSSNPSTSSPDPYGYPSRVSRQSAGSYQDVIGWTNNAASVGPYTAGSSPPNEPHHASFNQPHIVVDSSSANDYINNPHMMPSFGLNNGESSPKSIDSFLGSVAQGGSDQHYNYPYSVEPVIDSQLGAGAYHPRTTPEDLHLLRRDSSMQSPTEREFRAWFNPDGAPSPQIEQQTQRKTSSPLVDGAAGGTVRSIPVLEVRD